MTMYPVIWPGSVAFRTRRLACDFNEAVFEGQFSRQEQIQSHGGGRSDRWVGILSTTQLTGGDIALAEGFLASLRGRLGTFYMYDPDRRVPALTDVSGALWAGSTTDYAGATTIDAGDGLTPSTGVVDGASQSGASLAVTFDQVSAQVMSIGDYFQLGFGYHMLTADATTDSNGDVVLEFQPAVRVSPLDGQAIFVINPVMVARLDEQFKGADTGAAKSGVVSFSFHEEVK